jgi:hypothetical protein
MTIREKSAKNEVSERFDDGKRVIAYLSLGWTHTKVGNKPRAMTLKCRPKQRGAYPGTENDGKCDGNTPFDRYV